jgi:hypothetical protein
MRDGEWQRTKRVSDLRKVPRGHPIQSSTPRVGSNYGGRSRLETEDIGSLYGRFTGS